MSLSSGNLTFCRSKIRRLISPYLDDEIDAKDKIKLEAHLNKCQECREVYQNLLFAKNAAELIQIPQPAEPPEFPAQLLKKKNLKTPAKKFYKKVK